MSAPNTTERAYLSTALAQADRARKLREPAGGIAYAISCRECARLHQLTGYLLISGRVAAPRAQRVKRKCGRQNISTRTVTPWTNEGSTTMERSHAKVLWIRCRQRSPPSSTPPALISPSRSAASGCTAPTSTAASPAVPPSPGSPTSTLCSPSTTSPPKPTTPTPNDRGRARPRVSPDQRRRHRAVQRACSAQLPRTPRRGFLRRLPVHPAARRRPCQAPAPISPHLAARPRDERRPRPPAPELAHPSSGSRHGRRTQGPQPQASARCASPRPPAAHPPPIRRCSACSSTTCAPGSPPNTQRYTARGRPADVGFRSGRAMGSADRFIAGGTRLVLLICQCAPG